MRCHVEISALRSDTMKTRAEAATFLGISTRTLDRYTKAGRIPSRLEKGRTRPNVVYGEEDLAALKAELDERRAPHEGAAPSPTAMQRIGFRMEPFYIQKLQEAGARQGMSAGEYARHLLIRSLESGEREPILAAIAGLQEEINEMKAAVAGICTHAAPPQVAVPNSQEAVRRLQDELQGYRKEFAMVVFVLLTQVAHTSPDEALRWIRHNLSHTDALSLTG